MHDNSRSSMSSLISTRPERYWLMLGWRTPLIRDNSDYEGTPMVAALARLDNPPRIPAMLSDGWKEVLSSMTAFEPEDRATAFEVTQLLGALASREVGLAPTGGEPSLVTHAESAPAVITGARGQCQHSSPGSCSRTRRDPGRRLGPCRRCQSLTIRRRLVVSRHTCDVSAGGFEGLQTEVPEPRDEDVVTGAAWAGGHRR